MAFSPDGKLLYACGSMVPELRFKPHNQGVDVWEVGGGAIPIRHYFDGGMIADFALSSCGRWVYAAFGSDAYDGSRCCYCWDTTTDEAELLDGPADGMSLCASSGWVIG